LEGLGGASDFCASANPEKAIAGGGMIETCSVLLIVDSVVVSFFLSFTWKMEMPLEWECNYSLGRKGV
jgi:hypothetical protein